MILPTFMIVMFVFNVMASIRIFMRKWIHSLKGHHDQDSQGEKKWSTQVRHNKDLFTNAATPIFCIFLCIGIYVTSKNAMEFSVGNWGTFSFEITLKLLSFQNDKSVLFFRSKTVGYKLVLLQPAVYPHDCHSRSFLRFLGRSKETRSSNSWI